MTATAMRPGRSDLPEGFRPAIQAAGRAPSAHDTKPWRWQISNGVLDLFVVGEPAPLAVLSCGAALHHARLALAANGLRVTVTRLPDRADPAHLARLRIDGPAPVDPDTAALAGAIDRRHADDHAVTGAPIPPADLAAIAAAVEAQHVRLDLLAPGQIGELGLGEPGVGDAGPEATVAVLHGPGEQHVDWLHAGEALSAGSLVAIGLGVSVRPYSAPLEHAAARDTLRREISGLGHPYLVMRLGLAG